MVTDNNSISMWIVCHLKYVLTAGEVLQNGFEKN